MTKSDNGDFFDILHKLSDIPDDMYADVKDKYLAVGHTNKLRNFLISRSVLPNLRNTTRPPGEIYAPVYYDRDCIIKYIVKPSWDNVVTVTVWDLLIIDIDSKDQLPYVKKKIDRYYPDELFYIHETTRGYHLYLLSRIIDHVSKYAIYMRKKIGTDVAYGTNSLYVGCSIRLTRKPWEGIDTHISVFSEAYGNGAVCPKAKLLYQQVIRWIDHFHRIAPENIITECYSLWNSHRALHHKDFGYTHIVGTAPYILYNNQLSPNIGQLVAGWGEISAVWRRFMKYKIITDHNLLMLLLGVQYQMGYDNLYRILESTKEYAVGIHVQHNTYFISYKDLLFIDYDYKNRLGIIARYVRAHPEYTFRVTTSTKGYHVFLTSHRQPHNDMRSIQLLRDLRSDPAHILGVYHRGYSVRVNQKSHTEPQYREYAKYGNAKEIPELVDLYLEHLKLYKHHCLAKTPICNYQLITAKKIFKEEGGLVVY